MCTHACVFMCTVYTPTHVCTQRVHRCMCVCMHASVQLYTLRFLQGEGGDLAINELGGGWGRRVSMVSDYNVHCLLYRIRVSQGPRGVNVI